MIGQTWAIFVDTYRELRARRLFWVSLIISGIVVLFFGSLGINEKGLTILWYQTPIPVNTGVLPAATLYKWLFVSFGVGTWLTWAGVILALVSTTGLVPEMVSAGSVEMVLSRPIGRARLLFTKFAAGLAFVALQVALFTLLSIAVIGVRGGEWLWGLLVAVPLVTLFFSYLFSVAVVVGMGTRSGIAALIFTIVLWMLLAGLHGAEVMLLSSVREHEDELKKATLTFKTFELQLTTERAKVETDPTRRPASWFDEFEKTVAGKKRAVTSEEETLARTLAWYEPIHAIKAVLPKTTETADLAKRALLQQGDMEKLQQAQERIMSRRGASAMEIGDERRQREIQTEIRGRSLWWVVGTSLTFEAVMLGMAAWVFKRRDF